MYKGQAAVRVCSGGIHSLIDEHLISEKEACGMHFMSQFVWSAMTWPNSVWDEYPVRQQCHLSETPMHLLVIDGSSVHVHCGSCYFQVATREAKRLQRSNENHPGHAMARAYLETLADLPWNSFAVSRPGSGTSQASASSKPGASSAHGAADAKRQCQSPSLIARLESSPDQAHPAQLPHSSGLLFNMLLSMAAHFCRKGIY